MFRRVLVYVWFFKVISNSVFLFLKLFGVINEMIVLFRINMELFKFFE